MTDAPKRIVAWPGISGWLCGTWSQTRYPEDGQVYTRADLIDMDVLRRVEEDLRWIVEPIKCLEIEALKDGCFIDGNMALDLADDIAFARGKAKRALTDLRAMMEKLK